MGLLTRVNLAELSQHSINRMPKKLLTYIEQNRISVRCGKVYKLTESTTWNRYDEDWVLPVFAWLYKVNLITCNYEGVVNLTRDYYILLALIERTKKY